ncbi:MAG TPA: MFS transporter [Marmoricola sp.]|nr:MFS transporter [Marmoricola sp.]
MAAWALVWRPWRSSEQRGAPLPADVWAMSGVALCVALGFGVVAPAIPLFARQFGVDATAAGAVVSAFALMRLVSGPLAGRLVDRLGERLALMLGLGVVAVSSLLAGLAANYPQLLVLRGVGGVGSAVFGVAAVSLVLKVATNRTRGQAMSVYRSGFLVGGIVGPALGGAALGISLRAPFFLYAGTLVLAAVVAMVYVGRAERRRPLADSEPAPVPEDPDPGPTFREVLRTSQYQVALMANLAVGLALFGLRSAVVPLYFVEVLDTPASWVAFAFLASTVVQTALMLPAGRWSDTAGRRPALLVGVAGSAAGMVLLAVSDDLVVALVAMAVFGAGSAFLGSVPAALVGDVAGRRSGNVVAIFNMASDLGAVVGPVLAGLLVDHGSYAAAFFLGAGVIALTGVLGLRLPAGAPASDSDG